MLFKTLTPYYLFSPFTEYDLCSWVRNPVLLLFIMERLKDQAEYKWGETELQQKAKQGVEPIPTRTATHPITRPHILLQDNWGSLLRHPSISWIQWL